MSEAAEESRILCMVLRLTSIESTSIRVGMWEIYCYGCGVTYNKDRGLNRGESEDPCLS